MAFCKVPTKGDFRTNQRHFLKDYHLLEVVEGVDQRLWGV